MPDVQGQNSIELHAEKYPPGSRVEVQQLADGRVLVVVKKRSGAQMTIDTAGCAQQ